MGLLFSEIQGAKDNTGLEDEAYDAESTRDGGGTSAARAPISSDMGNASEAPPWKKRQGQNKLFWEFMRLSTFDFTRDIILVLEVAGSQDAARWEFVPVRNQVDTGSSENFVSKRKLMSSGMDMSKFVSIPEQERKARTFELLGGATYTPKEEVTLLWHKLSDRKQRKNTFLVVDTTDIDKTDSDNIANFDDLFDTLTGAQQFKDEEKAAFPIVRSKPFGM